MTSRKFFVQGEVEINEIHLREVNPLGRTGSPSLLSQICRVVIEHRRKVEHNKRKSAKRYLRHDGSIN